MQGKDKRLLSEKAVKSHGLSIEKFENLSNSLSQGGKKKLEGVV